MRTITWPHEPIKIIAFNDSGHDPINYTMSTKRVPTAGKKTQRTEINCLSCRHFFITYDPRFPYGCRAVGFKSRLMPAQEMYNNSGLVCLLFAGKEKER